ILVAVIVLCHRDSFAQNAKYILVGRVVDENGRPVAGADVVLEPENYHSNTIDRFIESSVSLVDGSFRIEKDPAWVRSAGRLQLFISVDNTSATSVLLSPPFDVLRQVDVSYNGLPVKFSQGQFLDVGNVTIKFKNGEVQLDFGDRRLEKTLRSF